MAREKILHIEKLRGLSILLVLLFHVQVPGFQNGYFGVDIFFVISGFLMASIYGDIATAADIKRFLLRRCSRILPAYYVVIIVTIIVCVFVLLPHEFDMVTKHSLWAVFLLPNVGFWLDSAYFDYTLFRPLLNLWSLGVEFQFYLLFPFLLLLHRRSPNLLRLLVLISFFEYALLSYIDTRSAFFLIPGRIWEFMLGFYALGLAAKTIPGRIPIGSLSLVLLLLFILLAPSFELDFGFFATCLVMTLTFVVISFGFSTGSENNALSASLRLLGKYSYSIYLVHFPVIVFVNYVPFGGTNLAASDPYVFATILATIGLLSYLSFNFVESITRNQLSATQLAASAISCCLVVMLLSSNASTYNLARLDPPAVKISNAMSDRGTYQCGRHLSRIGDAAASCEVSSGTDNSTRFLLFGDSHADSIKQPLADLLQSYDKTLLYLKGYSAINQSNAGEAVIAEAVRKNIDVVILHALPQPDHGAALGEFVARAKSENLRVAYIAPVPNYDFEIPRKLFSEFNAGVGLNRRGKSLQSYLERNGQLLQNLSALEARFSNFSWYPSAKYLCEQHCYISGQDWTPYYFDSNHLTLTGAAQLQPIFQSINRL